MKGQDMHYPKLPNRKSFLDKGYTSIQMREYAKKCVESALRQKKFIELTDYELDKLWCKHHDYLGKPINSTNNGFAYERELEQKIKQKNNL